MLLRLSIIIRIPGLQFSDLGYDEIALLAEPLCGILGLSSPSFGQEDSQTLKDMSTKGLPSLRSDWRDALGDVFGLYKGCQRFGAKISVKLFQQVFLRKALERPRRIIRRNVAHFWGGQNVTPEVL